MNSTYYCIPQVVIKKGIYTLLHPLEHILNFCWHCCVQQRTLYTSGHSLRCCRVCTTVEHHTQRQNRSIRWFLHWYILGAQLHCLFLSYWWCRSDVLYDHCKVYKEGLCGVLGQRRRSRWCLGHYIQIWWRRAAVPQHLLCRSGRVVPSYTLAGEVRRDEDHHKLWRALRLPKVDDQTDSNKIVSNRIWRK